MNAIQSQASVWGIPNSDGLFQIVVAEISDDSKSTLATALDDSDFVKSTVGDATSYVEGPLQGLGPLYRTYFFQGKIWVSDFSYDPAAPAGKKVLDAMIEANPNQLTSEQTHEKPPILHPTRARMGASSVWRHFAA